MKTKHPTVTGLAATFASLVLAATSAHAAPVQTKVFSATELAYAADVSNSDLLTGKTATTTGWNPGGGATTAQLNDGIHGGSFFDVGNSVQGTWTTVGATATYDLGPGANNLGYDITSIQSIAAWVNAGFGNQAFTVDVKLKGAAGYTTLATVDYEPLNASLNEGGTTKVTLTDDTTGKLATGVEFIRFTANSVNIGVPAQAWAFIWREIDVIGVPTPGTDNIQPTLVAPLNPPNNATGVVAGTADLVATFTEPIALGSTGNITIKNLTNSTQTPIPVGDPQISVSGAVLTIHPTAGLAGLTNYAIQIDATAIQDLSGNHFAGIADDTTWNFTTNALVTNALVQTKVFSTTELAFAGDVSNSDLLTGKTATLNGNSIWNIDGSHGGANPAQLNDGLHGGSFYDVGGTCQGAQPNPGATAEYNLGLGANNLGYDLTSIQSIAAWVNAGFGNQAFTVDVKLKGAASYTTLATVDYEPLNASLDERGATKVTLTHSTGVLARGVEIIRFTANRVNGTQNGGQFLWREIDVFGVPTVIDITPPQVSALAPADNASNVPAYANLVLTFNENIAPGSGDITIKNLSSSTQTVIPVGDPQVSLSSEVLTIHPGTNLAPNTNYAIRIGSGAIKDLSGNLFAGIANDTTWNFATGAPDLSAPTIVTLSPTDNATGVAGSTDLVATFNENIARGSGNITIKNLSTSTQTVIPVGDPQVSVSGAVLTINPTLDLAGLKNFAIRIDSGAIKDLSGNPFAGIANDTTWNVSTGSAPLRIMCLGDSITVGYTDNPNWNVPFKFGYRSGLYTRLTNAGYNFKLVGGSTEPWTGVGGDPTHGGTYTPALDLRAFGQDGHRGYGGKDIVYINSAVANYIAADTPDVILLLIGINGIASDSPAALNNLVNTIVTAAPNAHVIVAQITPLASFNQDLYNYNLYIRDTLVPTYAANHKNVTTVNLYSLFLTNPNDYSSAIAPNVLANSINHPDNPHYELMAQEWFNGIEALGLGPNTFKRWIADFPGVGALTGFNDDPDGDGIRNGLENFFGTDPGSFSAGVVARQVGDHTFTFTHPQNATAAEDIAGPTYRWSKDLATFHAAGTTDGGGTTVEFTTQPNTPAPGTTTITATVTGTPIHKLFVTVGVTQN